MEEIHLKVVTNGRNQFNRIKAVNISRKQRLDDLQDLRDMLRYDYQLSKQKQVIYSDIQDKLNNLIDEIDKYWWNLFTKGCTANE